MKRSIHVILSVLLCLSFVLAACSGGDNSSGPGSSAPSASAPSASSAAPSHGTAGGSPPAEDTFDPIAPYREEWSKVTGEVTMWGFNENVFQEIAEAFMQEFPNIKVNAVFLPFGELHDNLQTTLTAGSGAPDVAEVEMYQFSRYNVADVLEDLNQPPYNVQQFRDLVAEYNWERWESPDGKRQLGMPWDSTPGVYYYRADIFEELGLPSDPEELGEYIKDAENYLALVQVLEANGKYAMEWRDGPIHWLGDMYGYFDTDLNWVREGERYIEILEYTKRGNQLGWAPHEGYLSDTGKQLVKKGDLVAMALGSFAARELAANFPELAGKWRVTNLPFDIHVPMGGSSFVIPKQSKNKEAAWIFVQWCMRSENAWKIWTKYNIQTAWKDIAERDWYLNRENEYLGGQKEFQLYEKLAKEIPVKHLTPVDGRAWSEIWVPRVLDALDKNIDARTTLQLIKEDVDKMLKADLEKLRADLAAVS